MNRFYTSKDLNTTKDLEKKAKKSAQKRKERAQSVRDIYISKIRKLKQKVKEEFEKSDKIEFGDLKLYGGKGGEVSKDMIVLTMTAKTKNNRKDILNRIQDFLYKAFDLLSLTQFFIPKNFGTQEFKDNNRAELVFLKQNHDWEYIKDKPYIVGDEEEDEEGGPPSPGGGFGEEPPDIGGGPSPDIGGGGGGPEPEAPEPEGGAPEGGAPEGGGEEEPE